MIFAEEIFLLRTDDAPGKSVVDSARLDLVLAGALLLDLAVAERVDVAGPGGAGEGRSTGRAGRAAGGRPGP